MLESLTPRATPISGSQYWWLPQLMRLVMLDNSQTRPQVEAIDAVDRANVGLWFEGVIDEMSKSYPGIGPTGAQRTRGP